jgi:hypothetical protein
MKEKKKPKGTKAEIRAYKKRLTFIGTAIIVAILVAVIAVSTFLIYLYLNPSSSNQPPVVEFKTAIVDHLSITAPNQTFIETATKILETANFTVDYYPGEEVNVEFYRNLATHGYSLIVLRVHSAITVGEGPIPESIGLFTSEKLSHTKYVYEQLTDQVISCKFPNEETRYFGISPLFVTHSMKGKFQNTTIIQMGCDGLANTPMADVFIKKGAKAYIGWSGDVLASHTDKATTQLLEHLVTEKQTIIQALTKTVEEVGPDPAYGSILGCYPDTVADDYVIPNFYEQPYSR